MHPKWLAPCHQSHCHMIPHEMHRTTQHTFPQIKVADSSVGDSQQVRLRKKVKHRPQDEMTPLGHMKRHCTNMTNNHNHKQHNTNHNGQQQTIATTVSRTSTHVAFTEGKLTHTSVREGRRTYVTHHVEQMEPRKNGAIHREPTILKVEASNHCDALRMHGLCCQTPVAYAA
jgi:hypothetical protein